MFMGDFLKVVPNFVVFCIAEFKYDFSFSLSRTVLFAIGIVVFSGTRYAREATLVKVH